MLQKNGLLFGYNIDQNNDVFLRAEVKGFRKSAPRSFAIGDVFDYVVADYIKKIDDKSKIGLEVLFH